MCSSDLNAEEGGAGGPLDLWSATAESVNVVFAKLALDIGPERIVDMAHRLGVTSTLDAVPSITLGVEEVSTLEMANAYATLANGGVHCSPYAIERIDLPNGDPLYTHTADCEQVVEPDVANLVTAMLQRVVSGGTGTAARLDRPVAGKTGTGSDYTNVYFAGYTTQVATAVWIGFPSANIPMDSYYGRSVFGGTPAAPLWHTFMETAVAGMPVEQFPPAPDGINGTVGTCTIAPTGRQPLNADGSIAVADATCPDEGEYVAKVEGWDAEGGSAFDYDVDFFVHNAPPEITIDSVAPAAPAALAAAMSAPAPQAASTFNASAGSPVDVSATVTDPGLGDTISCTIDWGDGSSDSGALTGSTCSGNHVYAVEGT